MLDRVTACVLCTLLLASAASGIQGVWATDQHLTGPDDEVLCSLIWNGDVVVAGEFSTIGNVIADKVARWRDGQWESLAGTVPGDPYRILSLHVHDDQLHALAYVNSSQRQVWKLVDHEWHAVGEGVSSKPGAMATFQGDLFAGPYRWTGTAWVDEFQTDGTVNDLAVFDDLLVAGGNFATAGGLPTQRVAAWNGETVVNAFAGQDSVVVDVEVWNGSLFAGRYSGSFDATAVQRWTGAHWEDVPELGTVYYTRELTQLHATDQALLACGFWYTLIVKSRSNWGSYLYSWDGTTGSTLFYVEEPSRILTTVANGDDLLVGGRFTTLGTPYCANLGRVEGGAMSPVCPVGQGADGTVSHLELSGSTLAVGGGFQVIADMISLDVAVHDGSGWASRDVRNADHEAAIWLDELTWHNGYLSAAVTGHANNNMGYWAGGQWYFGYPGWGAVPNDLVSWGGRLLGLADGAVLDFSSYDEPPMWMDLDGYGMVLCRYGDDLVVGGNLTGAGGVPVNNVARIVGSNAVSMGEGLSERVRALGIWNDQLVAARWGDGDDHSSSVVEIWDGANWLHLCVVHGRVNAIGEFETQLVIGGAYIAIDTTWVKSLATWDGSTWQQLGEIEGTVYALAVHQDRLWVGGNFRVVGGVPAINLTYFTRDITGLPEATELPGMPLLSAPSPNPFNPRTTITLRLPAAGRARIDAYDARGRHVGVVLDEVRGSGLHQIAWDGRDQQGRDLPSGTYLLRARAGTREYVTKAVLVR